MKLSEQLPGILKRQFYIWYKKHLNMSNTEKQIMFEHNVRKQLVFKKCKFELYSSEPPHALSEPYDPEIDYHFDLRVEFDINGINIFNFRLKHIDKFNTYIDNDFKLEYDFCSNCEREMIFEDNLCDKCYITNYIHNDNCAICLENEGVWVELDCEHIFHSKCINKLKNKTCPLCRKRFVTIYPMTKEFRDESSDEDIDENI
jgi:hypothetical protein